MKKISEQRKNTLLLRKKDIEKKSISGRLKNR
jgi:hypothetical protein